MSPDISNVLEGWVGGGQKITYEEPWSRRISIECFLLGDIPGTPWLSLWFCWAPEQFRTCTIHSSKGECSVSPKGVMLLCPSSTLRTHFFCLMNLIFIENHQPLLPGSTSCHQEGVVTISKINELTSQPWHFSHTLCLCYDTNSQAGTTQGRPSSRLLLEHQSAARLVPFSCHHGYIIETVVNHSWTILHDLFLHSKVKAFRTWARV